MANNYEDKTTNYAYTNENRIISRIRSALVSMLENQGYSDWQVVRGNQPTIQAMQNKTVYFDVISKRRYGVQAVKTFKDTDTGGWFGGTVWIEDWLVQVSAFALRDPNTDTETTETSVDVATVLQACINGGGASPTYAGYKNGTVATWFPYDNIQIVRSTDLREIDFETDSGLKEKFPQFDFSLVVGQRLLKKISKIDKIEMEMERI